MPEKKEKRSLFSRRKKVVPNRASEQKLTRPFMMRFKIQEQVLFAKRLAMILRSGMPLLQGLHMLGMQNTNPSSSYIMTSLSAHVESGQSLSSGLQKFVHIFGDFCVNIVRVGETSGTLHENLNYLAEELKKKQDLRKKVVGALVYPAVIIVATVGISLVLTVYIFPKITPIFASFKTTLPLSTRILMATSNFLLHNGWAVFLGVIAALIAGYFVLKFKSVKRAIDTFILKLPLLGKLSQYYNVANMSRTLGLLLRSDVRIINALTIVSESTQNLAYRAILEKVTEEIAKGQRISTELRKYPKFFPPLATQMIMVGEQTGNLSDTLMYLSNMYEEEINDLTRNLTTMLEPILMVVMGIIVGFIAVSIITPIYGITQNLSTR